MVWAALSERGFRVKFGGKGGKDIMKKRRRNKKEVKMRRVTAKKLKLAQAKKK